MAHTSPADINACNADLDWERLQEIRESIVTRAPIFVTPSLVAQAKPQSPSPSQPQLRSQPLQASYYHPARSQTPPQYAMASYNPPGYGVPPSGLRAARNPQPQPVPFQVPQNGPAAQLRPIAGLVAPIISYKTSPFYESKYQIGDPKSLEGECRRVVLPFPRCESPADRV